MQIIREYVAIDPLALLLPSSVYQNIIELVHPHVPSILQVQEAAKNMTAEQKASTLKQAANLAAYVKVIQEAIR